MIAAEHGVWRFRLVDGPLHAATPWWFKWEQYDLNGRKLRESEHAFPRLNECIENAISYGYPKKRSRGSTEMLFDEVVQA
jgi:hypothetical protein